ncbi:hypothetical protein [Leucobacter sp. L43]|uniref:hypothetical protein n=1 Tax=Leucobacter sp. L43 TaxID=2798040 RepID=UPI001908F813|nr:hypothetical protein [Leucobacter sp. L43]
MTHHLEELPATNHGTLIKGGQVQSASPIEDRIYMVRETKSTANAELLGLFERQKTTTATAHFSVSGIDYAKSSPSGWSL